MIDFKSLFSNNVSLQCLYPSPHLCDTGQCLLLVGHDFFPVFNTIYTYLCETMVHCFCVNVYESLCHFLPIHCCSSWPAQHYTWGSLPDLDADLCARHDALVHACNNSWDWTNNGSTIFFWRWHPHIKLDTQDGRQLQSGLTKYFAVTKGLDDIQIVYDLAAYVF